MTTSPSQTIVCHEIFDENSQPSEEEILDYAIKIGIDPKSEPHLIPIARDGLMHALPSDWKPCFDSSLHKWYYFNIETGGSQWEHPLDPVFRDIVKRGRSEGYSSAGDDDSKTTAKEDLKSFEEVSDMLSSRSNDLRSNNNFSKQSIGDRPKSSSFAAPQPLLTRRKQLQQGNDPLKPTPLQTAKLVNSTLREGGLHDVSSSNGGGEWKGGLTPLRRAHTLDPIPDSSGPRGVPVKGILRDTSFPGAPPRSLARLDPMPGEYTMGMSDMEDERKRSVRFADFELEAMDIKFHVSDSEESIYGVDGDDGSGSSMSPGEEVTSEGASPDVDMQMEGNKKPLFNNITKIKPTPIKTITLHKTAKPVSRLEKPLTKSRSLSPFQPDRKCSKIGEEPKIRSFSSHTLNQSSFSDSKLSSKNLFMKSDLSKNSDDDISSETEDSFNKINNIMKSEDKPVINLTNTKPLPEKLGRTARSEEFIYKNLRIKEKIEQSLPDSESTLVEKDIVGQKPPSLTVHSQSVPDIAKVLATSSEHTTKEVPEPKEPEKPLMTANKVKKTAGLMSCEMPVEEMEEIAKKKASEKLAIFQDRLTKDIQDKIAVLKQQQSQSLSDAREAIRKEETTEKLKMRDEMEKNLKDFKTSLDEERKNRQEEIRRMYEQKISELEKNLETENQKEVDDIKAKFTVELQEKVKLEEERFANEKSKVEAETNLRIQQSTEIISASIAEVKTKEVEEIVEVQNKSAKVIDELKKKYGTTIDELEEKHKNAIKKVEEEYSSSLNTLQVDKVMELKRIETEWDDKITAASLQHKATLESAVLDHERSIANLRHQFQKDEEELKKRHSEQIEAWNLRVKKAADKEPYDITQINRDFEKMRCEKRLLEDKYRSLKEKYVQLKSDMRVAVERKLQSRARRKREEAKETEKNESRPIEIDVKAVGDIRTRNGRGQNNNNTDSDQAYERVSSTDASRTLVNRHLLGHSLMKESIQENFTDNDPSSTDDQYNSLSSAHATESEPKSISRVEGSNKLLKPSRMKFRKHKEASGNILDNVRTQLQELEQIEEKIPATAHKDTYVRYPFLGPVGLGTSAEVDFYRHRVLVEQEAVRAARECLLQQKRDLEARQNSLRANTNNTTLINLQQQEQDLTEMEVSIHRTRALLGEKMIRLRLLGQTLDRLVQEPPSPLHTPVPVTIPSPAGITTTYGVEAGTFQTEETPYNVLQNLENINCEIREIWAHLSKKSGTGIGPREGDKGADGEAVSPVKSSSDRRALESRLNALKQWLDQPPPLNNAWTQLTL